MDLRRFIANKTYWYLLIMQQYLPKENEDTEPLPSLEDCVKNYRIFVNNHISKSKIKDLYSEEQFQELICEFEEMVKKEYETLKSKIL